MSTDSAPAATDGATGPVATLRNVSRHFRRKNGDVVTAIDDVSLDVSPGEFLILLGPSGCGKTTLLRSVAGLELPDDGHIELHGRTVFDSDAGIAFPPEHRDLGMIFQSYALWPHMTVFGNVAYALEHRRPRVKKAELRSRVDRVLHLLGIDTLAEQHPSQLSGGQQQRVALARALVAGNDLILFDEPLSNVDAKVREHLRIELKSMQTELGFSAIYVTHDQAEAMELADRIAVVQDGRVAQIGTPREIYDEPASQYVANFVGTSNQLLGRLVEVSPGGTGVVEAEFGRFVGRVVGAEVGSEVVGVVRPSRCELTSKEPSVTNRWPVHIQNGMFLGSNVEIVVRLGEELVRIWRADQEVPARGGEGWLSFAEDAVRILPREEF